MLGTYTKARGADLRDYSVSRRMTFGSFSKYQLDDYLMLVALAFYTTFIPCINIVRDNDSNLLRPGDERTVNEFSPDERADRRYGSKMILVIEQCQCVVIWLAKGCLLILYLRLTTMRNEHIAIKFLLGYVIVTFVIMDILYFGVWCRPFHYYWAVPTPNPSQCAAATNHLITNAVFNLTSDLAMLAIGLPMFLRLNLPLHKKIPVVGVFSLGIFTILAAILNKVYSFSDPYGGEWSYWYVRESSTALIVANLPFVWTLWRRMAGYQSSMQGVSRQDSTMAAQEGTVAEGGEGTRRSSVKRRLSSWFRRGTNPDVELQSPRRGTFDDQQKLQRDDGPEMSAADFFAMDAPRQGSTDADPNPITHPHLFYSRQKAQAASQREDVGALPEMDMGILQERPAEEREAERRANAGGEGGSTPPSSAFPSLTSSVTHRSAEGFV